MEIRSREEDSRSVDARLKQIVASLPPALVFNPIMTALAALAFVIGPDIFGHIAPWRIVTAIAIQVATSVASRIVYLANRDESRNLVSKARELLWLQIVYSAGCGSVAWFFWANDNPVNNIFVVLLLVCVIWAGAFTRSAHRTIFTVGTVTTAGVVWLQFAVAPGAVAHAMMVISPVWTVYILVMGATARRRVDEILAVRFANEDLTHALRLARDDALRKRFEAEAANASKTIFLANMSHELRTPLNAILGFSDIIAEQTFGSALDRYREYARDIHNSGAHLLSLINDLLDVAKIEAGKMEIDVQPLDPVPVLESARRLMEARAQAKSQLLDFKMATNLPLVMADPRAVKQIILNLITNAVKFTQKGGHITVGCRPSEDGGFIIAVEDDGPGIPPEKLARVFKPFSQVDNRYDSNGGGTGLGLSLVQGLAQLHGGRAWIESVVGSGTKVMVYFPATARSPAEPLRATG